MISEGQEFQISQYADGTLPAADRAALETLLAENADARQMLAEYRRLDAHLSAARTPLPEVKWDLLADHLSAAIEASDEPAIAGRIGPGGATTWSWRARLAIAASIIVAISTGLLVYHVGSHNAVAPEGPVAVAPIVVDGPQAEASTGPVVAEIKIGPSPALAATGDSWRYAEGVVARPSSAVIAGEMRPPHDGESFIH